MTDKMDLHTHTIASGHAYNTRNEMISAAKAGGIAVYAITEHAPAMPGSCQSMYFMNFRALPREQDDMTVLYGAELNILDARGHVDLPDSVLRQMDLTLASLHIPCFTPGTREENTKAYINAMKNPYVNILAHPDDARYPIDYVLLVKAAKEFHVILEVNNASLSPGSFRGNPREQYAEMLDLCKVHQVPVVMNSDAHVDTAVGSHAYARQVIEEAGFPEELVVNAAPELLKQYINYYQRK